MTLTPDVRQALAQELLDARTNKTTIPLITRRHPEMTVEDSYAVQGIWAQGMVENGARIIGHKIGLTSKVMQAATGITEPDYGVIFDTECFESGAVIEHAQYSNVRIEVELAFHLKSDITSENASIFDVLKATDYIIPALEILDSRIEMQGRTIVDTISDNAAMGGMVVGGQPIAPSDIDATWIPAVLYRNETIEESGVSGAVLGHPALSVAWLARKLAQHGTSLKAGETILSGSFTRPMWVHVGDTVHAEFQGMGAVTCRFV